MDMTILKGLSKMNFTDNLTQHQVLLLRGMLKSNEWKIFNNYVKELVIAYLNTSESKDFLRGIKFAVSKFEEEIERM